MSEIKFTKVAGNKQVLERVEDIVYEFARLQQKMGLSDEVAYSVALKSVCEDGASPNVERTTSKKLVALLRLLPAFREESKDRLIPAARREVQRRKKARAKQDAAMRKSREAVRHAEETVGYPKKIREIDPRAWARWDAAFNAALCPLLPSWRPAVRTAGHAPRSARRSTRSAATASPGNDDDGGSDGPSDEPASPATPLVCDLGKRRNKLHSGHSRKYENLTDKLDRLQLGSAALLFCALASLIAGWSR